MRKGYIINNPQRELCCSFGGLRRVFSYNKMAKGKILFSRLSFCF